MSKHETMAFGDGYNDIELLAMAEYSFAMRNAFEETKEVANFITGYNDANAVQETIKRMLALQSSRLLAQAISEGSFQPSLM